jgi:hypothetical protein
MNATVRSGPTTTARRTFFDAGDTKDPDGLPGSGRGAAGQTARFL